MGWRDENEGFDFRPGLHWGRVARSEVYVCWLRDGVVTFAACGLWYVRWYRRLVPDSPGDEAEMREIIAIIKDRFCG